MKHKYQFSRNINVSSNNLKKPRNEDTNINLCAYVNDLNSNIFNIYINKVHKINEVPALDCFGLKSKLLLSGTIKNLK